MAAKLSMPPPTPPTAAPVMKPCLLPTRFMNSDAGSVEITVPTIIRAMGRVARPGSGLSCWPTTPLSVITVMAAIMNRVWPVTRMATLAFSRGCAGMASTGPG
ncbi:hypothetical protein [Halomonas sp. BC04]|uniref:hypothetical protein n=1 Tax=Halomonas sp. BC04 TaxID=1403540 RepID=UPI0003ED62A8|nr:hypothetical protein [Halomonas sp. BC04]EWH03829.1 hypothetical protein Q427_01190 [Halomonas sp. BC04]